MCGGGNPAPSTQTVDVKEKKILISINYGVIKCPKSYQVEPLIADEYVKNHYFLTTYIRTK